MSLLRFGRQTIPGFMLYYADTYSYILERKEAGKVKVCYKKMKGFSMMEAAARPPLCFFLFSSIFDVPLVDLEGQWLRCPVSVKRGAFTSRFRTTQSSKRMIHYTIK